MTRKKNGPRDLKNGIAPADTTLTSQNKKTKGTAPKPGGAEIVSLDSSPAFEAWLERQTQKLVQASTVRPSQSLVDLIRTWPQQGHHKKNP